MYDTNKGPKEILNKKYDSTTVYWHFIWLILFCGGNRLFEMHSPLSRSLVDKVEIESLIKQARPLIQKSELFLK
jgi:hypothetical protein